MRLPAPYITLCDFFYVLVFLFFPALCGTIINKNTNSGSIHSMMFWFISVKLASDFSLCVAGSVFCLLFIVWGCGG